MNFLVLGEAGSGKDTFADILTEYSPGYHRYAFGDEIRNVCRTLREHGIVSTELQLLKLFNRKSPKGLLDKLFEFQKIPEEYPKDRKLLQELGTYCRLHDDYIWIRKVQDRTKGKDNIIITDCRRLIEFNSFENYIKVYIESTLENRIERLKKRDGIVDIQMFNHPAELEIRGLKSLCDYVVENNGSLDEFRKQIKEVLKLC